MNQSNPLASIMVFLRDIGGYVIVLLSFLLAVTKRAPGEYPVTTGGLTFILLAVALWFVRWPKICQKIQTGDSQKNKSPFKQSMLDIFRSTKPNDYCLSIPRRRVETFSLLLLTAFSLGWGGANLTGMLNEFGTILCKSQPEKYTIVVANLAVTNGQETFTQERIMDDLKDQSDEDISICIVNREVETEEAAQQLGKQAKAAMVVWGRSDKNAIDIHVTSVTQNLLEEQISAPSLPDDLFHFEISGPSRLIFLINIAKSELYYIEANDITMARIKLHQALQQASLDSFEMGWNENDRKEIGKGYFLLGLLLTEPESSVDVEGAIKAYSEALTYDQNLDSARLNRGTLYSELGDKEKAKADFTDLVDKNSHLLVPALVNRSILHEQCEDAILDLSRVVDLKREIGLMYRGRVLFLCDQYPEAIADLQEAIRLTPNDFESYLFLGQAQLLNDDFEGAKQTFTAVLPHLGEGSKTYVTDMLHSFVKHHPELLIEIEEILRILD